MLPSCKLCARKEIQCTYLSARRPRERKEHDGGAEVSQGTTSSPRSNRAHMTRLGDGDILSSDVPQDSSSAVVDPDASDAAAIYFVASQIFYRSQVEFPRTAFPIPTAWNLHSIDALFPGNIATTYFETVHWWMPIISKRGFFAHLNPLSPRRGEINLLIRCMQLICSDTSSVAQGDIDLPKAYQELKKLHFEMETAGVLSLRVLQAGLLISLYEIGNAIYPAAYMTVGACARYGLALGIDRLVLDPTADHEGLWARSEIEENRRAWWMILLLDRYVLSINNKRPPLLDIYCRVMR